MTPSQAARKAKKNRKRPAGPKYTKDSYRRAIVRAVQLANVARLKADPDAEPLPHWHPNQLRHAAATAIRKQFGQEAAQVILGHRQADVTQFYAERDAEKAAQVMAQIG